MKIIPLFKFASLMVLLLLSSCGGGGGGGESSTSSASTSSLPAQVFSFAYGGAKSLNVGDLYLNEAFGRGTGKITYSSSDPQVLHVDQGLVTAVGPGIATITATIVGDQLFSSASTSYTIEVSNDLVGFSAWIGEQQSTLNFWKNMDKFSLFKVSMPCTQINISTCPKELRAIDNNRSALDFDLTLKRGVTYILDDGSQKILASIDVNSKIPKNLQSNIVEFDGKMYVISSQSSGRPHDIYVNSIYASSDGINWELKSNQLPMPFREKSALAVFEGKLWLIGGFHVNKLARNDVWTSDDGVKWTEVPQSTPFSSRYDHRLVVFDNKIWVMGGKSMTSTYDAFDVWASEDGSNWSLISVPPFAGWNGEFSYVVFKNKLWSLSGTEVWSSSDGIAWVLESEKGPLADGLPYGNSVLVFQDKLWAFPSMSKYSSGPIWTSLDGVNWFETDQKRSPRQAVIKPIEFRNQIWLIGSELDGIEYTVTSYNGSIWREYNTDADFPSGFRPAIESVDGKLLLLGEYLSLSYDGLRWGYKKNLDVEHILIAGLEKYWFRHKAELWYVSGYDIFSTENGLKWKRGFLPDRGLRARIVSFKNKLYLIGGTDAGGLAKTILSSEDGKVWTRELDEVPFPPRKNPIVKVVNTKIVLFGGEDEKSLFLDDVWISEDAKLWTKANVNTVGFSEIPKTSWGTQADIVSFNDKLWYISVEHDLLSGFVNNLWVSDDGINWSNQPLPFSGRANFNFVVHDQMLWVIGGNNTHYPGDISSSIMREVWKSADGIDWVKGQTGFFDSNIGQTH